MHYQDSSCARMRPWMRYFVFKILSRLVCTRGDKHNNSDEITGDIVDNKGHFGQQMDLELVGPKGNVAMAEVHRNSEHQQDYASTSTGEGVRTRKSIHLETDLAVIRKLLQAEREEEMRKEAEEINLQEWRSAGLIIDKFLFWVYLFVNVVMAAIFTGESIALAPLSHH